MESAGEISMIFLGTSTAPKQEAAVVRSREMALARPLWENLRAIEGVTLGDGNQVSDDLVVGEQLHVELPGPLDGATDEALAGEAILAGIGAKASDQLAPATLYTDIIEEVADQLLH